MLILLMSVTLTLHASELEVRELAESSWFSRGLHPVDVDSGSATAWISADSCARCHPSEASEWMGSRHRQAWTNPLFKEGFKAEHQPDRCIFCHAPLREQLDELRHGSFERRLTHEGINCAVCHVRDGAIHSARSSHAATHETLTHRELAESSFCAGCHEFKFASQLHGTIRTKDLASQSTFAEWEAYRKQGGNKTCQDCHMPDGRHNFVGAHSPGVLAASVEVKVEEDNAGRRLLIAPREVGHHLPTGDLFRRIVVEVRSKRKASFSTIATFGRIFRTEWEAGTGRTVQRQVSDTTIEPFEQRRVVLPGSGEMTFRVSYHFTSEWMEQHSQLPMSDLQVIIKEGIIGVTPDPSH